MRRAARATGPAPAAAAADAPAPTVTVGMEAVYTGDVTNYHDPRPEEPGDGRHTPLDPER
jgi:peptide/nickel transport system permease protein